MTREHKRLRTAERWLVKQLRKNLRSIKRARRCQCRTRLFYMEGSALCSCVFMSEAKE